MHCLCVRLLQQVAQPSMWRTHLTHQSVDAQVHLMGVAMVCRCTGMSSDGGCHVNVDAQVCHLMGVAMYISFTS